VCVSGGSVRGGVLVSFAWVGKGGCGALVNL
jgi:hypothetical protein